MVWLRVPYRLLYKRPQSDRGRKYDYAQPHRQENLPSYLHELVKAVTRERATIPDIEVHERGNFGDEPVNVLNADANWREEQDQANQSEHYSESRQADRLNTKVRMLWHASRAVEAHPRQKEKGDSGKERKHQIPCWTGQRIGERT